MSAPAALHEPQKVAQASCLFGADRLEACPTLQPAARFMAPTHVRFLEVSTLHETYNLLDKFVLHMQHEFVQVGSWSRCAILESWRLSMSTSANGARLAALTKDLLGRWRQTRDYWRDDKAREFEERYLLELESTVNAAISGIANLESVLRKIRSDCEQ